MDKQSGIELADRLNAGCQCISLDSEGLGVELERVSPGFHEEVMAGRPHLFSSSVAFVGAEDVQRMARLVAAVERVVALPAYRDHVLAYAPEIARHSTAARGVFLGYDFHLGNTGPQLIEINTNAGGGLLNAVLARAQKACCADVEALLPGDLGGDTPEHLFLEMFRAEWRAFGTRVGAGDTPRQVAIVDEAPQTQYLYPEFVLFRRLFEHAGIQAVICDPRELEFRDGALWHGAMRIDLVYNRLTDFALETPASSALRAAYLADAAVVTPHPQAHALYADKRNLVALSDPALLASWGLDAETRSTLTNKIPRTELALPAHADDLWARRKALFFKPAAGYGSKAAYRGDKITKRVFDEVLAGNYIAQALVPPSSRTLQVGEAPVELKLDLRNYVYAGHVQLIAARLWQGQTTNFRTPGGGFAPVLTVPSLALET
ncbi:MAG: hypothetical protein A3H93_06295 [Rhodocyclales bacterium RIFCSPLOWO2_02_FULL_63_24]|nr:MAG: hypothetical protein A2040_09965 [Rhodocyclales bacterium GWA2_65_19]OHC71923.1 MAG: hypothetical protein A3H93_06295 [Rhodocyclales bacterium RIFCSPLOWO2_02_FULL_63_24]